MARISVLMPAYNRGHFIGEAIASVLAQRDVSLELIVIDDASTDDTAAIAAEWSKRDARLRLLRLPVNSGASFALNAGLDAASGAYIARHDSDDLAMPGRFASQAAVLDAEPGVALVGTNYVTIDRLGRPLKHVNRIEPSPVLAYLLNYGNALGIGGNAMFRAATVRAIGGFSREFRVAQGYELWARLAQHGEVKILPTIGVRYRIHESSTSVLQIEEQKRVAIEICRRTVSSSVGRMVTLSEAEAVMARWWSSGRPGHTEVANSVINEAYEAFRRLDPPPAAVARVRVINSGCFARAALTLARKRHVAEAARCTRIASQWHPWGHPGLAYGALRSILSNARA